MGASNFYEDPNAATFMKEYQSKKDDLDTAMEEWEDAQTKLDEAGL